MGRKLTPSYQISGPARQSEHFPRLINVTEKGGWHLSSCSIHIPKNGSRPENPLFDEDEYDDSFAEYLIVTDSITGVLMGSLRLLRTVRPHILDTFFPDLCQDHLPTGPTIREVSQVYLCPGLGKRRRKVMLKLVNALVQYGLLLGITSYTIALESPWTSFLESIGWRCEPLGPAKTVDGMTLRAMQVHVDGGTLQMLRQNDCHVECELVLIDAQKVWHVPASEAAAPPPS